MRHERKKHGEWILTSVSSLWRYQKDYIYIYIYANRECRNIMAYWITHIINLLSKLLTLTACWAAINDFSFQHDIIASPHANRSFLFLEYPLSVNPYLSNPVGLKCPLYQLKDTYPRKVGQRLGIPLIGGWGYPWAVFHTSISVCSGPLLSRSKPPPQAKMMSRYRHSGEGGGGLGT